MEPEGAFEPERKELPALHNGTPTKNEPERQSIAAAPTPDGTPSNKSMALSALVLLAVVGVGGYLLFNSAKKGYEQTFDFYGDISLESRGVFVRNLQGDASDVRVTINDTYACTPCPLKSGGWTIFPFADFANKEGLRFDPRTMKVLSVTVSGKISGEPFARSRTITPR